MEVLVKVVMGWRDLEFVFDHKQGWLRKDEESGGYVVWNPLENLEDAKLIIDKFANVRWRIEIDRSGVEIVVFGLDNKPLSIVEDYKLEDAICKSALKIRGINVS